MRPEGYRSYVIRVRRRAADGPDPATDRTTRLDVEDLLEGGTATVSGDSARSFADSLERLVGAGRTDASPEPEPEPESTEAF